MDQKTSSPQRLLEVLEALLRLPAADLPTTLTHLADLVADATGADKIDVFLYDAPRDSLVALGTSNQPLGARQRQLGLHVLPLSNGGGTVQVFRTGEVFHTGSLEKDRNEVPGVRDALGVRSTIGVPVLIAGERRGVLMLASRKPEFFSLEDLRFAEAVGHWAGIIAHRAELAEQIGRNAAAHARRAAAEELVTVLAHDLRNFLAPLTLRLDTLRLRAERAGRADDVNDLDAAGRALGRLGNMVSDLLDVARIDRGLFHLNTQAVDLGALTVEVASTLDTPKHPVMVRVLEGERISVPGDPARLRQCLENLIANAIQQSPAGAAVSIFVRRGKGERLDDRALLEVADEGPGIPQELLPHLFDRYVTGDTSRGGLGLGLYLAERIAAVHGGTLSVESKPGDGARFILSLPARAAAGSA